MDNTFEDNTFNILHNVAGNIVRIKGNDNIGFNGNSNADLHVFHEDNNNKDGFKLENSMLWLLMDFRSRSFMSVTIYFNK